MWELLSQQAQRDPLENPPIKAVCRATSAAPTYLPPIHFTLTDTSKEPNETREFNLIDGGVVVNNPVRLVSFFRGLVQQFQNPSAFFPLFPLLFSHSNCCDI
jgi:patatin-like phospholipase/acyl hydrolase